MSGSKSQGPVDPTAEQDAEVITVEDDDNESDEQSVIECVGGAGADANISIAEVKIELDEHLKSKLVADLSSICSIHETAAKEMLEIHKWNMQRAIDSFFDNSESDSGSENNGVDSVGTSKTPTENEREPAVITVGAVVGASGGPNSIVAEADTKKQGEKETEKPSGSGATSKNLDLEPACAPEKVSVISWNLDGLDDKNLEKRTDAVIEIVLRENHDIVFFQELLPYTFDYISRRICSKYMPIPGTEDPACDYLTGTFLKLNQVHYEDHYIIPFPNTVMQRNLLVTKAFVGKAKIALLNTHLESTAEFSAQRKQQLMTCFEIAKSFSPEYNVLFGGDLNLRDKEVTGLLPTNMSDLWVKCGSRATCQYTWDLTRNTNKQMPQRFQPRCRFDRFYFRSSNPPTINPEFFGVTGIEKVAGTQSFPSDHWAIITFFRLSNEARRPAKRKAESDVSVST